MSSEFENEGDELTIDEHELLDLGAKVGIILQGLRYAVVFQDLDIVRKCVIDLNDCSVMFIILSQRSLIFSQTPTSFVVENALTFWSSLHSYNTMPYSRFDKFKYN